MKFALTLYTVALLFLLIGNFAAMLAPGKSIELRAIEAWKAGGSQMPQVVGGAVPFINLDVKK